MKTVLRMMSVLMLCLALCCCLGSAAFAEGERVVIPKDVTEIKEEAFAGCTGMTSVTIPASVTRIGAGAFANCSGLRDVYYDGTGEEWDAVTIERGNGPLTGAAFHCADDYYIELTYSNVFNPNEWNYKAAEKFAEMVAERTQGHVTVDYHGLNELDSYRASIVHAVNGDSWIGLEDPSLFAEWVGDCAVLVGPMLYQNEAEYNYVMDSDLVEGVKAALASENIHILDTHYSFGFRSVVTNLGIIKPADLRGVKLRSTTASLFVKTIESMGATPVPMSFSECLSAISQGTMDGFEGSTATLAGSGAPYELVKRVALTRHFIATRWLFMAESVYQSMPGKWRDALEACALECGVWEQESSAADEAALIEAMKAQAGVSWNAVDVDAFTAACAPVFDWIVEEYDADPALYGQIVGLVRDFRGGEAGPTRTETVTLNGKNYTAGYYGRQDISSWHEKYACRDFWRLENAFDDLRACRRIGDNLPENNYPMPVKAGQVYVVDYTLKNGGVYRQVLRCDGNIIEGMVWTHAIAVDAPIRTEIMKVGGKRYTATYYGGQDISGPSEEYACRNFWRLENAYEDFRDSPFTGDSLPENNYPMSIAAGQVYVIDYTLKSGGVFREVLRCDGDLWDDKLVTHAISVD